MSEEKFIDLRKPEERDLDLILGWIKNEDYYHFVAGDALPSAVNLREMVLNQIEAASGYDSNIYLVMETKEGASVGMVMFHFINWKNSNAFMEVYLLDDNLKNKLIFDAAYRAALEFAFQELNLHKICFYLFEYRHDFFSLMENMGAKREQVLRKHFYCKKKFYDVYLYGLLRGEYEGDKELYQSFFSWSRVRE